MKLKLINLAILLTFFISCNKKQDHPKLQKVEPPLKNIKIEGKKVTIDPTTYQVVRFDNGTSIDIPANAFTKADSSVVTGEVTIEVKTYNTPSEIITSGIPMTFNHNDQVFNFESAGMFEISGTSDGEPVFIRNGSALKVNYPSNANGDFDFFYFDEDENVDSTRAGQWIKLADFQTEITPIDTTKIIDYFSLNFASEDYPELAPLTDIKWKLATNHADPNLKENQWVLNENWSSLSISRPKYGFGETLISEKIYGGTDDFWFRYYPKTMKNGDLIVIEETNKINIWNRSGKLINSIPKSVNGYGGYNNSFKITEDDFLIVDGQDGHFLFNDKGEFICRFDFCYDYKIVPSQKRVISQIRHDKGHIRIKGFNGKIIKDIYLNFDDKIDNKGIEENWLITPNNKFVTNSYDGIRIYDLDGNLIKEKHGKYRNIRTVTPDTLLIEELNGTLTLWDLKNNKSINSKQKLILNSNSDEENKYYNNNLKLVDGTNKLLVTEYLYDNGETKNFKSRVWDFRLNTVRELPFAEMYSPYDSLPKNLIPGFNNATSTFRIYDLSQNKNVIVIKNADLCINCDYTGYKLEVAQKKNYVLFNDDSQLKLFTLKGDLVQDFKKIDSLIFTSYFKSDSTLYTISKDGYYRLWSVSGKEIESKKLDINDDFYAWKDQNLISGFERNTRENKYYNLNGDLLISTSTLSIEKVYGNSQILYLDHDNNLVLKNLFGLDLSSIYQLELKKDKKTFFTYVYLGINDLDLINQYLPKKLANFKKEEKRKQLETKVYRSFEISKFGLYNWDRIIKELGSIKLLASFEFDVPIDFNSITVFHITKIDGKIVINYSAKGQSTFAFNPNASNQLLAVLPNNKVALFSESDFKNINTEKVKSDSTYTFKLKSSNKTIENILDLDSVVVDIF